MPDRLPPSAAAFAFNEEKKPGEGEDANPLNEQTSGGDLVLLATFDGMGGAGGQVYETDDGPRSGAYLGANAAGDAVRHWFETYAGDVAVTWRRSDLERLLADALTRRFEQVSRGTRSRFRGKIKRQLPTTASLLLLDGTGPVPVWHALWAGDSRAYLLEPDRGLAQLTQDHLRGSVDAQENLREDSAMSNCLSASEPFHLEERAQQLDGPAVLLSATDGCFGYVDTPAEFEHILLRTLREARDEQDWQDRIRGEIGRITADDSSLALHAHGWRDFAALRRDFESRLAELDRQMQPVHEARSGIAEARRAARLAKASRAVEVAEAAQLRADAELDVARVAAALASVRATLRRSEHALVTQWLAVEEEPGRGDDEVRRAEETVAEWQGQVEQVEAEHASTREEFDRLYAEQEQPVTDSGTPAWRTDQNAAEARVRDAADQVWEVYREGYERLLSARPPEPAPEPSPEPPDRAPSGAPGAGRDVENTAEERVPPEPPISVGPGTFEEPSPGGEPSYPEEPSHPAGAFGDGDVGRGAEHARRGEPSDGDGALGSGSPPRSSYRVGSPPPRNDGRPRPEMSYPHGAPVPAAAVDPHEGSTHPKHASPHPVDESVGYHEAAGRSRVDEPDRLDNHDSESRSRLRGRRRP